MRSRTSLTADAPSSVRALPALAAALFLSVACVAAAEEPATGDADAAKVDERFTATAMNLNSGPGPSSSRLTVRLTAWSTDEQRADLLKVLADKGSAALVDALREQKSVGTMSFPNTLGYDLRYARAFQEGETRHLVVATDRPVGMVELMRNTRTLDKGVTIVHLALDAEGKGTGELLVGAELSLDPASREITVEHLGTQPVKLTQVQTVVPKKKG